jgi:hypothetical protein
MSVQYYDTATPHAHPFDVDDAPTNTPAQLSAEICARLVEWGEGTSKGEVLAWMMQVVAIAKVNPHAAFLYLSWGSGNVDAITRSFADLGADACLPKQGVHSNTARALRDLSSVNPELGAAMTSLYRLHRPEAGDNNGRRVAMRAREAEGVAENIFQVS